MTKPFPPRWCNIGEKKECLLFVSFVLRTLESDMESKDIYEELRVSIEWKGASLRWS